MRQPLVSIIMPVYNGAKTIKLALQSLIAQSYHKWECIVVNDGSTDETLEIVKSFCEPRIKLVDLGQNHGRGYARDVALHNCSGDFLCFLDADDFLHPDKLLKQVRALQQSLCAMVGCGVIEFDEDYSAILSAGFKVSGICKHKDGNKLPLFLPTVMFRKEKSLGLSYNLKLDVGEDYDFLSRCVDGCTYTNIQEPLYFYRVDNTTRTKLLYYTKENIRSGYFLSRRNRTAGVKMMLSSSLKYVIYYFWSLAVDTKSILSRRGNKVSERETLMFVDVYNMINKLNINKLTGGGKDLVYPFISTSWASMPYAFAA